ncbi:Crp/Fnr family transcriptional regulator [Helicobacter canadensis]|uniref:cAMP-binding protein n=1 Tax=Helicobacter canadensis MIT 98-5491 TaxID=537970 RepID=C5ZZ72_9HELI|nr:Crp/Fnr family transcriptional regulator [Helicobacter canadensis]EES89330.1 putative cAMP-binding protein [Helicobacter canadensis MIT 98-5491]EFR48115.1 cyclic nucleotide-binding domain protein [Helicobacter canadensis MIT 98-5491]STO99365.1 transcription regulator [Helicobacter canadensis]
MENLGEFEPFCELDLESQEALSKIAILKNYKKKEIIFYEEDEVREIYFLIKGSVKIYKVDRFDNEVFFGISTKGLLNDYDDTKDLVSFMNVECMEDSLVACFDIEGLRVVFDSHPQILKMFFKEALKRIKVFENVVLKELIFDSTAKVAYSLYYDLEEFNTHKKQENAAFLNIQPETLSRILKKMHRDNVIETNQAGKIEILDQHKLQMIFKQDTR